MFNKIALLLTVTTSLMVSTSIAQADAGDGLEAPTIENYASGSVVGTNGLTVSKHAAVTFIPVGFIAKGKTLPLTTMSASIGSRSASMLAQGSTASTYTIVTYVNVANLPLGTNTVKGKVCNRGGCFAASYPLIVTN